MTEGRRASVRNPEREILTGLNRQETSASVPAATSPCDQKWVLGENDGEKK